MTGLGGEDRGSNSHVRWLSDVGSGAEVGAHTDTLKDRGECCKGRRVRVPEPGGGNK